jgi:hypothetical protein
MTPVGLPSEQGKIASRSLSKLLEASKSHVNQKYLPILQNRAAAEFRAAKPGGSGMAAEFDGRFLIVAAACI